MNAFKLLLVGSLTTMTATAAHAQDRPSVVVVNYPLQYLAEQLLGEDADVTFPVPQDVDPSFWRPSIADISMIQSADLILLNGAGFATWVDRVSLPRAKLVNTTAAIEDQFIVTESIIHSHGDGGAHSHEGLASYTWLDPMLAFAQAEAIAAAITTRGLSPEDQVKGRLETLQSNLSALDTQAATTFAALADTTIITTHPRYQYLASRYDLTLSSLEWEAGSMPTDAELADLQALVTDTGASVLIWEAAPPAAAFEITAKLGLNNVVFPSLAHAAEGQDFIASFENALDALAQTSAP